MTRPGSCRLATSTRCYGALARVGGDRAEQARLRNAGPPRAAGFTWKSSGDHHLAAYAAALRGHA